MISLKPIIKRVQVLLDEDTDQSVTYAALEARLAIEKVTYDRLRQAHDYISHAQLRRWQPGGVIKTLIADVGGHVTDTLKMYVSKGSEQPGEPVADEDWVELGTQVGLDAKRVGELWNALSGLALHVKLPTSKDDDIPDYGDRDKIKIKVGEVLAELERLSKATLTLSGVGEEVSFDCGVCGEKNKRRAKLLGEGQRIFCINPDCDASLSVRKDGNENSFQGDTCDFACQGCGQIKHLPWRFFLEKLRFGDRAVFECLSCKHKNYVEWRLTQVAPAKPEGEPIAE